jgi:hypothetical protein
MDLAARNKVDREFSVRAIMPRLDQLYEGYCEKRIEPSMGVKRIELLGVLVDCATMDQALDWAEAESGTIRVI